MPWKCGWKSKLARACTPPPRKTLTVLILQLTLSNAPIQVVPACTWMWPAIYWPSMEMGADKTKEPQVKTPKKQSPSLATRPKKYALEMWMEIKTSTGVYSTPKEDSYSVDFAIDTIKCTYPGCTSMHLDVAGHILAFYGKKTNPRAGLLHDQGVIASKAIANIPTWMGYFARWRVRCVSISEASEILAGCKRLEKESLRRAHWNLQHRFSSMQLHSPLSATARPFQPRATPSSALVDDAPKDYPAQDGLVRSSPARGSTRGLPVREATPNHHSSNEEGVSTDTTTSEKSSRKRWGSRRSRSNQSGSDSDETLASRGR